MFEIIDKKKSVHNEFKISEMTQNVSKRKSKLLTNLEKFRVSLDTLQVTVDKFHYGQFWELFDTFYLILDQIVQNGSKFSKFVKNDF